ncbi:MAG: Heme-degrading protein MhuD (no EC), partial [uncultured Quadrisphaera sp.]
DRGQDQRHRGARRGGPGAGGPLRRPDGRRRGDAGLPRLRAAAPGGRGEPLLRLHPVGDGGGVRRVVGRRRAPGARRRAAPRRDGGEPAGVRGRHRGGPDPRGRL